VAAISCVSTRPWSFFSGLVAFARSGGAAGKDRYLVVASKLGLIAFRRESVMVAFGSHGGANGDSRSRFLVVAIELCGLWLKYNRNSIDLG
jgi:hypothetical protein